MDDTYKEYLDKTIIFINRYAFHTWDCDYHYTEVCTCGYLEKVQSIRKLYNEINEKRIRRF